MVGDRWTKTGVGDREAELSNLQRIMQAINRRGMLERERAVARDSWLPTKTLEGYISSDAANHMRRLMVGQCQIVDFGRQREGCGWLVEIGCSEIGQ